MPEIISRIVRIFRDVLERPGIWGIDYDSCNTRFHVNVLQVKEKMTQKPLQNHVKEEIAKYGTCIYAFMEMVSYNVEDIFNQAIAICPTFVHIFM